MNDSIPRIAVTAGEPAGIGPDLCLALAERDWPAALVAIADPQLLADRARRLGLAIEFAEYGAGQHLAASRAGRLTVCSPGQATDLAPGRLNANNAGYVLASLNRACDGCLAAEFDALVTGPVHKGVINDAGIPFSGHTEYLARRCDAGEPVMLLVAGDLRVALVTTHLPLRAVPDHITRDRIIDAARILDAGLRSAFGLDHPRLAVLGLNPHAGESGHLGTEEQDVIEPAIAELRAAGIDARGPLPADTAFTPPQLAECDAVLAMYHDQGLTVLKHRGFGNAVNVTLGLPITRTSVDHGTALELAGTGKAHAGSLIAAVHLAIGITTTRSA